MTVQSICGGSILNPTWILTAQHCEIKTSEFEIFTGSDVPSSDDTGYDIKKLVDLDGYNEKTHEDDFKLIQLTKPIKFTNTVKPVCLPKPNQIKSINKAMGISSGWGYTSESKKTFPNKLQATTMKIKTKGCDVIENVQICGVAMKGSELCEGDSGSPLVIKSGKGKYVQVGVVSVASGFCGKKIVYGDVSNQKVYNWIIKTAF